MTEYATKDDVEVLVNKTVNKAVDDLSQVIQAFAQNVDARFDRLEKRVHKLQENLERPANALNVFLN